MDLRVSLIKMLQRLMDDMLVLHQQGAGYYSCVPLARRYNKLLSQAETLVTDSNGLMATFEEQVEHEPDQLRDHNKQHIGNELGRSPVSRRLTPSDSASSKDTQSAAPRHAASRNRPRIRNRIAIIKITG